MIFSIFDGGDNKFIFTQISSTNVITAFDAKGCFEITVNSFKLYVLSTAYESTKYLRLVTMREK